ncbi:hypothetical protein Dred_1827 [Desulforamulus reducens MI-1]|uniref:DUF4367 domain-containing protein n=1 Tax=Desulforamulus reducens (strain ATCC BAA-1160 / DSM 100696 / MI-1) TaxID=349161 RepID=A4J5J9_DESRM|nr:DUF4367 domain-containing protein [Desulforamulus reducens]ABO50352.1 hypothetical protein Dred_1827 [Desulforamulus reducens MI-1]
MSEHKYTSIDELIKKSLKERAQKETDVDMDLAWEKFNNKYNSKPKFTSKWTGIACSLVFLLVAGLCFLPKEGTALNLKFLETIKSFVAGKVQTAQISFSTQEKEKDLENSLKPEVAQALKEVPYEVLLPADLTGQYNLEKAMTQKVGDSTKVMLFLKTTNSELVNISEINIIGDFNQATSYDTEDAVLEKVNVKGQNANLLTFKDGKKQLCWVDRDVFVTITGPLNQENLFILATSLRRVNLQ